MSTAESIPPRVERMLDSAAELLVRWGYQRVTIDEVARHAGIGKGTVYLHFRSKDALFLTVLLRVQRGMVARVVQRMEADPREVLPACVMRSMYTELAADPVARSLYIGDAEVLGRLAHEASGTVGELTTRRQQVLHEHLQLLESAGCLRAGLDPDSAGYAFSAIGAGFLFLEGLDLGVFAMDSAVRAELLERTIAAAVQAPEPPVAELARLAPAIAKLYRSLEVHIDNEWRRRVR
jgi:AcrR family transcriptional regulator